MRLALILLVAVASPFVAAADKPNVIVILADDLGWTDLACFGSDLHETPHLDQLAKEGMKFTQHYSACTVCSPTRAALLTGKYPARLRITDWIPGQMPDNPKLLVPEWTKFLPLTETTVARHFKQAGYVTASIGKWHLGGLAHYPEDHGFDLNIAGTDKPQPKTYFAPWGIPTLSEGKDGDYLTDRLGEEAVKFVERTKDKPFFLYFAHFAVHTPIQARADLLRKYQAKMRAGKEHRNAAYAAMVESMDETVGKLRTKLTELKLAERTIIVFASDNGGRIPTTSNKPLRYGKASAYEGGVRVPLIVHWPGVVKNNSICEQPCITMDLFPTLLEMANLKVIENDGVSLIPILKDNTPLKPRDLFWHYPHHQHYQQEGTMPYGAIRRGDWKLVEFFNDMRVELYNIRDDIGEKNDLAATQPERAKELKDRLHAWRTEVGAQMPTPNPKYDPTRPEYTTKK